MLPTAEVRRILWAVDAFPEDHDLDRTAASVIKNVFGRSGAEIEPVYVLVPDELDRLSLSMNFYWQRQYEESAAKALAAFTSTIELPNLKPGYLLRNARGTLRSGVEALNEYAKSTNADLIVVSSHARKGLARMFLGSFAESLMLRAEVPVLVVNPHSEISGPFRDVLFPTDLSEASQAAFERVLQWAKHEGASVTLFHLVPDTLRFIAGTGIMLPDGSQYQTADMLDREFEARRDRAREWAEQARGEHGVLVECVVERSSGDVAKSLLSFARKAKPSLIAMSSDKGPVAAVVMGSTTRQVVRGADCPVWIFHSKPPQTSFRQAESGGGLMI